MITKEEREKDRAICEAATPGPWAVDPNAEDRTDVISVSRRCAVCYVPDEGSPDGAFIAAARDRLPLYVATLDIHDAKLLDIETLLKSREDRAEEMERSGQHVSATILRDKALGLRDALHILRGEK